LDSYYDKVGAITNEMEGLGRGAPDGYANGFDTIGSISKSEEVLNEKELMVPVDDSSMIKCFSFYLLTKFYS